ncbi:MAG: mechanosensitive ion channel family protein [Saprospiraceae bacterium]|nr:mechanosensitive ion channel family protein [Saprospiraceae bacterium]
MKEPQPEIGIEQFGETNLLISVRPYVLPDDYWTVYYEAMSRIKYLYFENDIKIAFQEGMELGKVGKYESWRKNLVLLTTYAFILLHLFCYFRFLNINLIS